MGSISANWVGPISLALAALLPLAYICIQLAIVVEFVLKLGRYKSWRLYLFVIFASTAIGLLWFRFDNALVVEVPVLLIAPLRVLAAARRNPASSAKDWLDQNQFFCYGVFFSATVSILGLCAVAIVWLVSL